MAQLFFSFTLLCHSLACIMFLIFADEANIKPLSVGQTEQLGCAACPLRASWAWLFLWWSCVWLVCGVSVLCTAPVPAVVAVYPTDPTDPTGPPVQLGFLGPVQRHGLQPVFGERRRLSDALR